MMRTCAAVMTRLAFGVWVVAAHGYFATKILYPAELAFQRIHNLLPECPRMPLNGARRRVIVHLGDNYRATREVGLVGRIWATSRDGTDQRRVTPGRLLGMMSDRQFCKKNCREKRLEGHGER